MTINILLGIGLFISCCFNFVMNRELEKKDKKLAKLIFKSFWYEIFIIDLKVKLRSMRRETNMAGVHWYIKHIEECIKQTERIANENN